VLIVHVFFVAGVCHLFAQGHLVSMKDGDQKVSLSNAGTRLSAIDPTSMFYLFRCNNSLLIALIFRMIFSAIRD
jgi:hypothetical protein